MDVGPVHGGSLGLGMQNRVDQRFGRNDVERGNSGQHLIENSAKTVHVAPAAGAASADDLRSKIGKSPRNCTFRGDAGRIGSKGKPKIYENDSAIPSHHDVARRDIAMDDTLGV